MIKRGRFEILETLTEPVTKQPEKIIMPVKKGRFEILIESIPEKPVEKYTKIQGRFEIIDFDIEIEIIHPAPPLYTRLGRFEILELDT